MRRRPLEVTLFSVHQHQSLQLPPTHSIPCVCVCVLCAYNNTHTHTPSHKMLCMLSRVDTIFPIRHLFLFFVLAAGEVCSIDLDFSQGVCVRVCARACVCVCVCVREITTDTVSVGGQQSSRLQDNYDESPN